MKHIKTFNEMNEGYVDGEWEYGNENDFAFEPNPYFQTRSISDAVEKYARKKFKNEIASLYHPSNWMVTDLTPEGSLEVMQYLKDNPYAYLGKNFEYKGETFVIVFDPYD